MNHRNLIIVCIFGGLAGSYLLFLVVSWLWVAYYMSFGPEPYVLLSRIKRLWSFITLRIAYFRRGQHEAVQGTHRFVYEPLDSGKPEIRLLKLLPGSNAKWVECTLFKASLDDKQLKYETLSYTWGSCLTTNAIVIDKMLFPVTANLEAALRRLRRPDEPRILWVDAICINQQDSAERSQQVGLMKRIYSQASNVVIWLGRRECHKDLCTFFDRATERGDAAVLIQGMHLG
jgi:hypothetical protein